METVITTDDLGRRDRFARTGHGAGDSRLRLGRSTWKRCSPLTISVDEIGLLEQATAQAIRDCVQAFLVETLLEADEAIGGVADGAWHLSAFVGF